MAEGNQGLIVPVIVDTNIIVDVITDDPRWSVWSIAQLEKHDSQGLVINPFIYCELCYGFPSRQAVDELVKRFGLTYEAVPRLGLFNAAKAFHRYKSRRGRKHSVLPDFFIGGHAEATHQPLLTRDKGRYATYFQSVKLICPT